MSGSKLECCIGTWVTTKKRPRNEAAFQKSHKYIVVQLFAEGSKFLSHDGSWSGLSVSVCSIIQA